MIGRNSLKLVFPFALSGLFSLSLNTADAQRYKDRGDQTEQADERQAQDNPDSLATKGFANRLVYGSNFNLAIGNPTYLDISPILGYRITPKLQAGVGGTYIFYYDQQSYYYLNSPQTYNVTNQGYMYGGRIYAEYDLFSGLFRPNDKIFAHGEVEMLNVSYFYIDPTSSTYLVGRTWITDDYVGIGYREPFGRKGYFLVSILYNANFQSFINVNPFGPLTLRLGVTF